MTATDKSCFSTASDSQLQSRSGRVLLWSWWVVSLVVTAAYTGTLTSFLSVTAQPLLFSTARDLLTKAHHYTWGTVNETELAIILKVLQCFASFTYYTVNILR